MLLAKWIEILEKARKTYEPLITSPEERAYYTESKRCGPNISPT